MKKITFFLLLVLMIPIINASVYVATTESTPWLYQSRSVCTDNIGNIYIAFRFNDTIDSWYMSNDSGANWTNIWNLTRVVAVSNKVPSVACSGSNIVTGMIDPQGDWLLNISTDNGVTWNSYEWDDSCNPDYSVIEILGNKIYALAKNTANDTGASLSIGYTNGTIIHDYNTILTITGVDLNRPSIAAIGSGNASDKVFINMINTGTSDMVYSWSLDGGETWATNETLAESIYMNRVSANDSEIFVSYYASTTDSAAFMLNSTWGSTSWTDNTVQSRASGSSITDVSSTFDNTGNICMFYAYYNRTGADEREQFYECMKSNRDWTGDLIELDNGTSLLRNIVVASKYNNDAKMHYVYRLDSTSDYIYYGYVQLDQCVYSGSGNFIQNNTVCNITANISIQSGYSWIIQNSTIYTNGNKVNYSNLNLKSGWLHWN